MVAPDYLEFIIIILVTHMISLRAIVGSFIGLALFLGAMPVALAQTSSYYNYNYCNNSPYNNGYYYYNSAAPFDYSFNNCPHGSLFVYVQVNQPALYNTTNRQPSDFSVSVTAQNASKPSFVGSNSGTEVLLIGSYSVRASSFDGYVPTYSTGCTGNLSTNTQATCVITETPVNGYPQYPYSYPQYPQIYPATPVYQQYPSPSVVVTPAYVPTLPNTGFEPLSSAGGATVAFAVAALIVVALLSIAYVRKAFAYIGS